MPLPENNEADESRTQSLGVKRSLATYQGVQEDVSHLPRPKKQKRVEEPSHRGKQILARPFGEKYDFQFAEYNYQLKGRRARTHIANRRKGQGLPPLPHFSDPEGLLSTEMSIPSTNERAGPLAWNQGPSGRIRTSLRGNIAPAPGSKLGNNRLATGFVASNAAAVPSPESLESGETHSSPIEISSDDEEGGLLINVEGQATPELISVNSDSEDDNDDQDDDEDDDSDEDDEDDEDDDEEMEDGEDDGRAVASASVSSPVFGDSDAHMQLQGDLERHLSNDFLPLFIDAAINKKPALRLASLSAAELENQYKYCFYGLARDQIDLNRPAICIECLQEGHSPSTCPEKHCFSCQDGHHHSKLQCPKNRPCTKCRERGHEAATCQSKLKQAIACDLCSSNHHAETDCPLRFFPSTKQTNASTLKLWISCCNCASKTHLVGDCPALHPDTAPRWSLRTLTFQQINNLSLQTGISSLEKAAESRNMRPQGRDIRPAKRQHQQQPLNQRKTFEDSSEDAQESFLRQPFQRQTQNQPQKGSININLGKQASLPQYQQSQRRSPDLRERDRERYDRYDRYDAPNSTNSNRSRGPWYDSDSFGQRRRSRSRSPDPYGGDSYRPSAYSHDQRRPYPGASGSGSLGERVSFPQARRGGGGGYERGLEGDIYRHGPGPGEGGGRAVRSTYQGYEKGRGGIDRVGMGQGGRFEM